MIFSLVKIEFLKQDLVKIIYNTTTLVLKFLLGDLLMITPNALPL